MMITAVPAGILENPGKLLLTRFNIEQRRKTNDKPGLFFGQRNPSLCFELDS